MPSSNCYLPSAAYGELPLGRRTRKRCSCADCGAAPNCDRSNQLGAGTNESIVPDHCSEFVDAVVIASNRAGADIDARTNISVADVCLVIDFRTGTDRRLLHFNKVADMVLASERCPWAKTRIWSDAGSSPYLCAVDMTEGEHFGARPNNSILDDAVGADANAFFKDNFSLENAVDVNFYVLRANEFTANVYARRINERDALIKQHFGLRPQPGSIQ